MQVPHWPLVYLLVLWAQCCLRADDESLQRFLTEAPAAWREAMQLNNGKKFARELAAQETFRTLEIARIKRIDTVHWFGDSSRIEGVITTDKADGGAKTVAAAMNERIRATVDYAAIMNSDYVARLVVKPTAKLSQILPADSAEFDQSRNGLLVDIFPGLTLGDRFMPHAIIDLPEYVEHEFGFGYRVKDVQSLSVRGEQKVMRVFLKAHSFGGRRMTDSFREGFHGHVDLLPDQRWAVHAFYQEFAYEDGSGKFVVTQSCRYGSSSFHPEFIELKEVSTKKNGESESTVSEISLSSWSDSGYVKSDCRLTAFGLPEPKPLSFRNLYSWAAILLAVIVSCASVLIFNWKKRGSK